MATIKASVDVGVPVSTAYDQWTQFEEFPSFMEGVREVHQIDDTTVHWIAEVDGERREWVAEIVEQQPDQLIEWRAESEAPSGRVTFEPSDAGTRISLEMSYETEGMKQSVGSLLGLDERRVEDDLERFKELVEQRETPTGSWRGRVEEGGVVEGDQTVL